MNKPLAKALEEQGDMDTEVDWILSCLDKADRLVVSLMTQNLNDGNKSLIAQCLFEARSNINRAIEAISDSGLNRWS